MDGGKPQRKTLLKAVSFGTSIAATLAGLVLGGFFLGKYLDTRWGTQPWLEFSLMIAGLVLGGAYIIITLMKLGNTDE